jgi:hypothetical protein
MTLPPPSVRRFILAQILPPEASDGRAGHNRSEYFYQDEGATA